MVVTKFKMHPTYQLVRDLHHSSGDYYVMLLHATFEVQLLRSEEGSLTLTAAAVLADAKIRVPDNSVVNDKYLVSFTPPDLSITGSDRAFYSDRANLISGCDYVNVPSAMSDWAVANAYHDFDIGTERTKTIYIVQGSWSCMRGLLHSLTLR